MIEVFKTMGLDEKYIRIITCTYWNQTISVRANNENTNLVKIPRGVIQG